MKEEFKKRDGYTKTKDFFAFDDGLAERQSALLVVACPLLATLTALIIQRERMTMKVLTLMPLRTYREMLQSSLETPTLCLMPGGKNTSLSSSLKLVNLLCRTGHLDFTNNSGVQDPLLQAPQAMARESNQSKMPLGCLPYGKGYHGLVSKGSRAGSQATGQPVHFNPVLSAKRKWRLTTYHQPSCSKPVLGEGVLQDGGTASSENP